MIEITYKLENAGWAIGKIGNGENYVEFDISYLNDSLKELADSAIELKKKKYKSVFFMTEPGEHRLVLNRNEENIIEYELHWYSDWFSWNLKSEEDYEVVLKGKTTLTNYVNQVRNILEEIMMEFGEIEYKRKWKEHEFPVVEYRQLK